MGFGKAEGEDDEHQGIDDYQFNLKQALEKRERLGMAITPATLDDAIREGAVQRVRPKAMTVAVILAGLLPIMFGGGTGSEVMQRIAAPMVGGIITAPLLSMFVIPAEYQLLRRRSLQKRTPHEAPAESQVHN